MSVNPFAVAGRMARLTSIMSGKRGIKCTRLISFRLADNYLYMRGSASVFQLGVSQNN